MKRAGTPEAFDEAYRFATRNRTEQVDMAAAFNTMCRAIAKIDPRMICEDCDIVMREVEHVDRRTGTYEVSGPEYERIGTVYECPVCHKQKPFITNPIHYVN